MPRRSDLIAMPCPECGGQTVVKDSRPRADHTQRRRRECMKCGTRSTTTEIYNDDLTRIEAITYNALLLDLDELLKKYGKRKE